MAGIGGAPLHKMRRASQASSVHIPVIMSKEWTQQIVSRSVHFLHLPCCFLSPALQLVEYFNFLLQFCQVNVILELIGKFVSAHRLFLMELNYFYKLLIDSGWGVVGDEVTFF